MLHLKFKTLFMLLAFAGFYLQSCSGRETGKNDGEEEINMPADSLADTLAQKIRDVNEGAGNGLDEIKDGVINDSLKPPLINSD